MATAPATWGAACDVADRTSPLPVSKASRSAYSRRKSASAPLSDERTWRVAFPAMVYAREQRLPLAPESCYTPALAQIT